MMGHTEVDRLLVEAGADPNAKTINGQSAYQAAKRGGDAECARLLKAAGGLDSDDDDEDSS